MKRNYDQLVVRIKAEVLEIECLYCGFIMGLVPAKAESLQNVLHDFTSRHSSCKPPKENKSHLLLDTPPR